MLLNSRRFKLFISIVFLLYAIVIINLLLFRNTLGYIDFYYLNVASRLSLRQTIQMSNFIPFRGMMEVIKHGKMFILQNIAGNIIGFVPLGILVPLLWPKMKTFSKIAVTGFLTSLSFETIQLFARRGWFDVDDIILNTLGTILGFALLLILFKTKPGEPLEQLSGN